MKFIATPLAGALVIEPEPRQDERGLFARVFCQEEFRKHGLNPCVAQCNVSFNRQRGTVRGMHFQRAPHQEAKLMRCTAGTIYDVCLDLRPASPTFRKWFGVELSADQRNLLYIPEDFAHGYQTLTDGAEVFYQVSRPYHPESEGGVRWDDPAFAIDWPMPVTVISERDRSFPEFRT